MASDGRGQIPGGGLSQGGATGSGGGPGPGDGGAGAGPVFAVGGADHAEFDGLATIDLGGFRGLVDWSIPSVVLGVPGLLVVLAVLAQASSGVLWLPIVRRRLGTFGLGRRRGVHRRS